MKNMENTLDTLNMEHMEKSDNVAMNKVQGQTKTGLDSHHQATLLGLPQELRDEIYFHLLASADLSILRSSHQISLEALEFLYTKATFRQYVNSAETHRNVQPSDKVAEKNPKSAALLASL